MNDNKQLHIVTALYKHIQQSALFRLDGHNFDIVQGLDIHECIIRLCDAVHALPPCCDDWLYLGENSDCALSDFISAAYWAYVACHDGKRGYQALCALGQVFKPGMTSEPVEGDSEHDTYIAICEYLLK